MLEVFRLLHSRICRGLIIKLAKTYMISDVRCLVHRRIPGVEPIISALFSTENIRCEQHCDFGSNPAGLCPAGCKILGIYDYMYNLEHE